MMMLLVVVVFWRLLQSISLPDIVVAIMVVAVISPHTFRVSQEGLDVPSDYPVAPEWKPFDNLTWLDSENEKKTRQEYMEKRRKLYEQRSAVARWRVCYFYFLFFNPPADW